MRTNAKRQMVLMAAVALTAGVTQAAIYSWTPTAAGTYNWDNASSQNNWGSGAGGAFPNAMDDVANITSNAAGAETINLNQAITLGILNIGDTNTTNPFTIAAGTAGSVTFQTTGFADAQLNVSSTSKGDTISAPVTLASNLVLTQNSANTFAMSGVISGAGALTKSGAGALTLSVANGYSGATSILAGTVNFANASAFGSATSAITLGDSSGSNAVTLNNSSTSSSTLSRSIVVASGNTGVVTIKASQSSTASTYSGSITLGSDSGAGHGVTLSSSDWATTTYSGVIKDPTGLIPGTAGVVTISTPSNGVAYLNGNNTFTGGVVLKSGNLAMTGKGLGTGTLTIDGGNLRFSQSGDLSGANGGNNAQIWNTDFTFANTWSGFTLNLGSGAVNLGATGSSSARTVTVSTNQASDYLTVGGIISDGTNGITNGLTKAGNGTLNLYGANTYTGTTTIKAGTLKLGTTGTLGNSATDVLLGDTAGNSSATLTVAGSANVTVARNIVIQAGNTGTATIGTSTASFYQGTYSGSVTLGSGGLGHGLNLTANQYDTTLISGQIKDPSGLSGPAGVVTVPGGTVGAVALSGDNTFSGGLNVLGTVQLRSNTAAGTGVITVNGGSLGGPGYQQGSAPTVANDQVWNADFSSGTGAGAGLVTTGAISLTGSRALSMDNTSYTAQGVISDSVAGANNSLTFKGGTNGSATWTLSGANTFGGGVLVVASSGNSTLSAGNASAMGSGQVRLSSRGTSRLSLNTDLTIDSLSSAIAVPTFAAGSGGTNGTHALLVSGGGGSGAAGTVTIASGAISAVTITNYGRDYTSIPTFSVPTSGGTGTITGSFAASNVLLNARRLTIAGTNALPATYSGVISGTGGLTKDGAGTQILSGTNTYTGTTILNNGSLIVNGSLASGSAVTVNGGSLGGSGTINGPVSITAGTLAPGNSPGILNTGALTFASGANYSVELNGTTVGTQYDQTNVTGAVNLGGASLLASLGYAPTVGDTLFILNNDGSDAITGTFAGLAQDSTVDLAYNSQTYRFQLSYVADSGSSALTGGNDVALTSIAIPEPSTIMAALSVMGLSLMRRQRPHK